MNEKNFEFLKDQVKYTGFGESLEGQLKANLSKAQTEFRLEHSAAYGKDELSASLHFKKSAQSDMYFFNSYTASLKKPNAPDTITQTFYINKEGRNISLKEAFNLLDGRAVNKDLVNKEGQIYNAWQQLDFKETTANGNYKLKQFSQQYGFDLEKALAKHPIIELKNEQDKTRLLESLQRGNRQSVTFSENGVEQKRFVEANPQFKSVAVYDEMQHRIRQGQAEKKSTGETQSEKQDSKKQTAKAGAEDESQARSQKSGKRKGMSV